jgi:hypothetical protein
MAIERVRGGVTAERKKEACDEAKEGTINVGRAVAVYGDDNRSVALTPTLKNILCLSDCGVLQKTFTSGSMGRDRG